MHPDDLAKWQHGPRLRFRKRGCRLAPTRFGTGSGHGGGSACLAVNDTVKVVLTRRLVPQAGT